MKKSLPQSTAAHLTAPSEREGIRGAESSPPTLALQFVRSVIQSKPCGGSKPPPYPVKCISCADRKKDVIYYGSSRLRLRHYPFVAARHFP